LLTSILLNYKYNYCSACLEKFNVLYNFHHFAVTNNIDYTKNKENAIKIYTLYIENIINSNSGQATKIKKQNSVRNLLLYIYDEEIADLLLSIGIVRNTDEKYFYRKKININDFINGYSENPKIDISKISLLNSDERVINIFKIFYLKPNIEHNTDIVSYFTKIELYKQNLIITYILENILLIGIQTEKSFQTINNKFNRIILFHYWAYKSKIDYTISVDVAIKAYTQYSLLLESMNLSSKEKSLQQKEARILLITIYNDFRGDFFLKVNTFSRGHKESNKIKSNEKDRSYNFKFYTELFEQISNFLLNSEKYPFQLNLPHNNNLWVWPSQRYPVSIDTKNNHLRKAFCYKEGKINKYEEIKTNNFTYRKYIFALNELNMANNNIKDKNRIYLANFAIMAYFMHFISVTGMNVSNAAKLTWKSDYHSIDKEEQGFKTIKLRANGKIQKFKIGSKMIKYFKKYISLRSFLINEKKCESLFFQLREGKPKIINEMKKGEFGRYCYKKLSVKFDPNLPNITASQMRVNIGSEVSKEFGPLAAANILQNNPSTFLKHYSGTTLDSHGFELNNFFESFNTQLITSKNEQTTEITIGNCRSYHNPSSEVELKHIKIDCKQQEGCLFCKHYCIHKNKEDIRKLYSMEYVIKESEYTSPSYEIYLAVFDVVLKRIEYIINHLIKMHPDIKLIVDEVKKDVYENGNLTYYWSHKLNILIEMGLLK